MARRVSLSSPLRLPYLALVLLALAAAVWTGWMIRGLLLSVVVAAFIVVLFAPAKTMLLRWVGPRPKLVASVLTVAALVLIVLPTAAILYLIVGQILSSL